jgi:adenosylhomocysteine nucleosidase
MSVFAHTIFARGKTPPALFSGRPVSGRLSLFLALVFLAATARTPADIALIVAVEEQAKAARKLLIPAGEPHIEGGRRIESGFYRGERVHLVLSGAGLVPTAQTTTMLLSRHPIDVVVSYGIAGGLGEPGTTEPGSVVVATEVRQHNLGVSRDAGSSSAPRPDLAASAAARERNANDSLLLAERAAFALVRAEVAATTGTLVCGDEFIASAERRRELRAAHGAVAVDMNGSGITIPAESYGTPWLVARRITDRADGRAGADFAENTRKSWEEVDRRVLEILLAEALRRRDDEERQGH